ncbi:MAG: hypothetical protein ACKVVP_02380 [Chloroflexota bacterium]
MSLQRVPQSSKHGSWLTLLAMGVAAIAGVQLITGSAPILWLLLTCAALWMLLAQASHAEEAKSVRVRSAYHRARSARR